MSDSKKTNEMDDEELEQVAGGLKNLYSIYRCPKCDAAKKVRYDPEFGTKAPYCMKCSVLMIRYL